MEFTVTEIGTAGEEDEHPAKDYEDARQLAQSLSESGGSTGAWAIWIQGPDVNERYK